jgi:hypothetical protein
MGKLQLVNYVPLKNTAKKFDTDDLYQVIIVKQPCIEELPVMHCWKNT